MQARMVTSDHALSHSYKGPGAVRNGLTDIKTPFRFQLELKTPEVLRFATHKNLEG